MNTIMNHKKEIVCLQRLTKQQIRMFAEGQRLLKAVVL